MLDIDIFYSSVADSVSRLITGFHMLGQQGNFRVRFHENNGERNLPDTCVVEADIDDFRIAFDMGDRWALAHESGRQYLKEVNAYFARDYTTKIDIVTPYVDKDDFKKVHSFGFNYYSTYPGNPMNANTSSFKRRVIRAVKDYSGYSKCMYPEYFEGKADYKPGNFKILFNTRLWDADSLPPLTDASEEAIAYRNYMVAEWNTINDSRIKIIRALSAQYGKNFSGGVQHSALAEKMCPDLILPTSAVRKKSYLDQMKSSDICIGSIGLHKSNSWKTGEYVAAARAIVAEKLYYDVPGNFDDGNHYIPFTTVEECVDAVGKLYNDPDLVYSMKKANEEYYSLYLKPDVQIMNAINIAFSNTDLSIK